MRLTALDIREQQFRRVMRGFDPDEVVTFLDTVASEYEQLVGENRDLRQRLLDLEHQIAEFQNMEKALRDTLMTAERVTAETRDNAQKEAALILREAEVTAQQATAGISSEILQKRRELTELQQRKKDYLLSVRSLAQSHLEMIDSATRALDAEASFSTGALRPRDATGHAPHAAPADASARDVAPSIDPTSGVVAPEQVVSTPPTVGGPQADVAVTPRTAQTPSPSPASPVETRSPLPSEAGGVIPSAVPKSGAPTTAPSQDVREAGATPPAGWAEASFEPGDLVPRSVVSGPRSVREAELYRRGITPEDPLPSLLRGASPVTTGAVSGQTAAPSTPQPEDAGGADHTSAQAVRPDGSQGD
jgi:cell division initiation protein